MTKSSDMGVRQTESEYAPSRETATDSSGQGNHTAYKQFKGRKTPAEDITDLYEGLKQSGLNDFDVLLSGYISSAEAVEAVGKIGRNLKYEAGTKPGSFFWVLDPVMGDNGRLYVNEEIVPAYKSTINQADMILPNQFEAEVLSGVKITDYASVVEAITVLHTTYFIPHVLITSLELDNNSGKMISDAPSLTVIGSTARKDHTPRLFKLTVPALPMFFSGTGDMFAALAVARFRAAITEAGLSSTPRWQSPDDVSPPDLPLAGAATLVLASMQSVLRKTVEARNAELEKLSGFELQFSETDDEEEKARIEKELHLKKTKAAEVRIVQNANDLREPPDVENFRAEELHVEKEEGVEKQL
ncbi:MAG: putative pyridoxal kinase [Bogoriella megaspora]|nr:MAG: putative pyridoxal kinase [Bogoriella megaspora]